jgi:hypothetical protein
MGIFSSGKNKPSNPLLLKSPSDLTKVLTEGPQLVIQQKRELTEVFLGIETINKYMLFDVDGAPCGSVIERSSGLFSFLKRIILGSHRPFEIDVFDASGKSILELSRSFFWFFSDIKVKVPNGPLLGSAHRKFSIFYKIYELKDANGNAFAKIQSSMFKIWTFALRDLQGNEVARISKKWTGMLKEYFTDSDNFLIEFGNHQWGAGKRAVILAAAISVDFDFFENNNKQKV